MRGLLKHKDGYGYSDTRVFFSLLHLFRDYFCFPLQLSLFLLSTTCSFLHWGGFSFFASIHNSTVLFSDCFGFFFSLFSLVLLLNLLARLLAFKCCPMIPHFAIDSFPTWLSCCWPWLGILLLDGLGWRDMGASSYLCRRVTPRSLATYILLLSFAALLGKR